MNGGSPKKTGKSNGEGEGERSGSEHGAVSDNNKSPVIPKLNLLGIGAGPKFDPTLQYKSSSDSKTKMSGTVKAGTGPPGVPAINIASLNDLKKAHTPLKGKQNQNGGL